MPPLPQEIGRKRRLFPELFCDFSSTAGSFDLSLGRSAVSINFDIELLCKLAAANDLNTISGLFDDTGILESLYINSCAVFKFLKSCNVNSNDILTIVAFEASLGESSEQRHLAAFESRSGSSGTCLLSFVAVTGCLSVSGSMAAAFSVFAVLGTVSRS